MYYNTGLTTKQIDQICDLIREATRSGLVIDCPPILGMSVATRVTAIYLRRNRTQADLAETYGVSQSTISRAITSLTPVLAMVLGDWVPVAEDLHPDVVYVVDGTLLPYWSWACLPGLYSGKHKTTGLNVQVAATLDGRLAWVSDPVEGRHHDAHAIDASGIFHDGVLDPGNWIGDKGYIGRKMVTPVRKPPRASAKSHLTRSGAV